MLITKGTMKELNKDASKRKLGSLDTWEKVIVCVLLWLEKKLDAKRETEAKCKGCGEPSALICAHCGDPEC